MTPTGGSVAPLWSIEWASTVAHRHVSEVVEALVGNFVRDAAELVV